MRIRIVRKPPIDEDVEGLNLHYFHLGSSYDVGILIASLFLAEGWAEPIELDAPPDPEPFSTDDPFIVTTLDLSTPPKLVREQYPPDLPRDIAADKAARRRRGNQ